MHRRVAPVHFWNDVNHLSLGRLFRNMRRNATHVSSVRGLLTNARRHEQFISLFLPLP
jgi:hypothetical protein